MPAEPPPPPPAGRLGWSGATDKGPFRSNNEDVFVALAFDHEQVTRLPKVGRGALASTDFVFAVSDGMGGARSGEFASRIAVERITRIMPLGFRRSAGGTTRGYAETLGELMTGIHRDLLALGRSYEECAGMGATLSLCWFTPGAVHFSHVGDSRIYRLRPGGVLEQLSQDHSYVGGLRRSGQINEREARTHPRRNALQQVLGAGHQFVEPQFGSAPCVAGDRLLLCSDGVVDGLWDRQIGEILGSAQPVEGLAPALVAEAVAGSGRDNATALVVEMA